MLEQGAKWLASTLTASEGVAATYTRATEGFPIDLTIIPGRMRPERHALADGRANLEVEPADFLVLASAIDFGDGPVEPATGDRVTLADGRTYELMPRDGEPSWRALTQYPDAGTRAPMLRLRTIRVKVVP